MFFGTAIRGPVMTSPCASYCLVPFGTTSPPQLPKLATWQRPGLASDALRCNSCQGGWQCQEMLQFFTQEVQVWTKLCPGWFGRILYNMDHPFKTSHELFGRLDFQGNSNMLQLYLFRQSRATPKPGALLWVVILKKRNFSRRWA